MNSPIEARDTTDPGDQVLRKFRYQHAYGVILAASMAAKTSGYTAIWCEQHEDFLAEESDVFDAYQIKTRESELGKWDIADEAFYKSVARFAALDVKFPKRIRKFKFVSNTNFSDTDSVARRAYSPPKLLQGVAVATNHDELLGPEKIGFEFLVEKTGVAAEALFLMLKRMDIVLGPTERAYEDELCQRHISTLPECKNMSASALGRVMEELIARVGRASSLVSSDPSRDWVGLMDRLADPYRANKRLQAEDVTLAIRGSSGTSFRYLPGLASLQLGSLTERSDILKKKMDRGGLSDSYESMRRRSLTAEQTLLELAPRLAEEDNALCSQIENVVLGECEEAKLRANQASSDFGRAMLIDVQDRLKKIVESDPDKVHQQSYELLIGVAGLLTSECKVWWSPRFNLEGQP